MEKEKKEYTTEEIVNVIAKKPKLLNIILFIGMMTVNMDKPLIAYFPKFGGYLPYSEWRCLENSTDCLQRTDDFLGFGWKVAKAKEMVYVDSRCSIKLGINTNDATLRLFTSDKTTTANIHFQISANKLTVKSNSSCPSVSTCDEEKDYTFDHKLKERECQIDLKSGYDSAVSCSDSKIKSFKFGEVYGLRDASTTVRYMQLDWIGSYELYCPDPSQYKKAGMCGVDGERNLKPGKDFYWYTRGRSTFAIDWDLYCGGEVIRAMIGSIYFGGAFLGTSGGGILYDTIGRKNGALVGYALTIVATFCSAVAPSVEFFFVCRFFQGCGSYLGMCGMFVLLLEYTSVEYRNIANSSVQFVYALGYLLITFLAYFIKSWHWLAAISGVFYCASLIPILLVPESPRYFIARKNDHESAKASLEWLKRINKSDFDLDAVTIKDAEKEETNEPEPGFIESLKDFIKYSELTLQLVLQMFMWLVVGFLYYGFSFSWDQIGNNLYLSYLYAAIGESIAYIGMTPALGYFGRKLSLILFFFISSGTFLLAMLPYSLGTDAISIEHLSCLVGVMFVSAAFGTVYLYTTELAPTSHRGKVLGYSSFAARIGSFCGPQADLLFAWNKKGTFILFSVLAGLAGLCVFRLPETNGIPTPNTAEEVQQRRKHGTISITQKIDEAKVIKNPNTVV